MLRKIIHLTGDLTFFSLFFGLIIIFLKYQIYFRFYPGHLIILVAIVFILMMELASKLSHQKIKKTEV